MINRLCPRQLKKNICFIGKFHNHSPIAFLTNHDVALHPMKHLQMNSVSECHQSENWLFHNSNGSLPQIPPFSLMAEGTAKRA